MDSSKTKLSGLTNPWKLANKHPAIPPKLAPNANANNLTTISGAVLCTEDTLTDQATIAWDVIASPVAKVTLGANRTLTSHLKWIFRSCWNYITSYIRYW